MQLQIFAIYDKKAEAHLNPFFLSQKGQALRELQQAVQNEKTMIFQYPEDFSLWKLGDFDNRTGILIPLVKPEFLEEASVYAKDKSEEKTNV
jgi:hypothetical protein